MLDREVPDTPMSGTITPAELMAGLSRALDLTEGEPMGHSIRSCWIGMTIAKQVGLEPRIQEDLYYALLLKDVGCSANAAQVSSWFGTDDRRAKTDLKEVNWSRLSEAVSYAFRNAAPGQPWLTRIRQVASLSKRGVGAARELVEVRCTIGAGIVRSLGWSGLVPDAVLNLDEHWDGSGHPQGVRGEDIPILSRILLLAQTVEIFGQRKGPDACRQVARERSGHWFDPSLVAAFLAVSGETDYFEQLGCVQGPQAVVPFAPKTAPLRTDAIGDVLKVARVFGQIVDTKSSWTAMHSMRTAYYARAIAERMGLSEALQDQVLLAGFFHDLGKLGVSNLVLDKPGPLNSEERAHIETHAELTYRVLEPMPGLRPLAYFASCHHERLDGGGYYRRLAGEEVPLLSQVIAVADVFDALTADRPYRAGLSVDEALAILGRDAGARMDADAFEALVALPLPLDLPERFGLVEREQDA